MAKYPNNFYEPRNFENLPGLNRLTADKKNLYAEDLNETNAEIVAIETILGKNPNGAYASVKAWLEALASGGGGVWGGITGTLSDQTDLFDALNAGGKMPALKVFTSSGTYYPSSGVKYIEVEAVGGGGGGGKSGGSSSSNYEGSGGGAGGYAKKIIAVDDLGESETITIGGGGFGSTSIYSSGGTGGTTYFGTILSASGGRGGSSSGDYPGAGGSGTGGDINIGGGNGYYGNIYRQIGSGGLSFLCVLGAGGEGGGRGGDGQVGKSGVVIIKEFF